MTGTPLPMLAPAPAAPSSRRVRPGPWVAAGVILLALVIAPALGFLSLMGGAAQGGALRASATQLNALSETGLLLLGVVVLAGSMGAVSAWLVSIYDFPFRRLISVALVLPLALPTYLAAFIAVDFLDFFGPVQTLWRAMTGAKTLNDYSFFDMRSLPGAIIVLALVLYPYVYVSCRLVFAQSGRNVIDAARMLGARGGRLFFGVGLALARPALIAGSVLVVLETLNDIGATEHLGISSLSVVIRDLWLNRADLAAAARLAGLLLVFVALLLAAERRFGRSAPTQTRALAPARHIRLGWGMGLMAFAATATPVLFGFVVPAGYLLGRALIDGRRLAIDPEFGAAALTSVTLALAVALVVMGLGAILAIAIRIVPRLAPASRLSAFGYAVPATVLVLSVFPVLRAADDALAGLGFSLAVSGTAAAVLFALSIRFIGIGSAQAGLALSRLSPSVDWVARVHGMGDRRLAIEVHLAAMRPGLMLGGTLVFIDTIKELPATLLLRPLNFETLATRAYAQASAGTFENAALDSLAILALSGLAALMLARRR